MEGVQDAINSELVAIFGNFVNRAFVLMHKLCKGKVPPLHVEILDETDKNLFAEIEKTKSKIEGLIEGYKFRDALFEVIDLARKGNKYLQEKEPWEKSGKRLPFSTCGEGAGDEVDNCLHICLQLTANLAIFINPFLPFAAKKMCYMMKVVDKMLDWENAGKTNLLSVGYSLREPQLLFRKIEDSEVAEQIDKLKIKSEKLKMEEKPTTDHPSPTTDNKPTIQFDDFAKIDLKVGTILTAEKVEKADKLLKLEVDFGFEKRIIVSGIALHLSLKKLLVNR